jgi:hypothetical protein
MKIAFRAFCLLLFFSYNVSATTYYSRVNGAFYTASTWSNSSHTGSAAASSPCTCGPCTVSGSNDLFISHAVAINCDLSFSGNPSVIIENGGSLNVTGNASVTGSASFTIDPGAVVNVTGNFDINGGGGSVTVNGTLNISGNLTVNGSFPFCGTGTVNLFGSLTGTGGPCNTLSFSLPVSWLSFEVKYKNLQAELNWATASEVNNHYFTIEKSNDGILYSEIARKDAAGNSTSINLYTHFDKEPFAGINYYRISQTDFDGHVEQYKVIALFVSLGGKAITVYPSFVRNNFVSISFTGFENEASDISLLDNKGAILQQRDYFIQSNHEQLTYYLPPGLTSSTYFINIISKEYFNTQKIIISTY